MSSDLMGALVRRDLSREAVLDLDASLAIQEAADLGNTEALAFVDEAGQRLAEASEYREQATRLRGCALEASSMGSSTLSAFGADVARLSGMEAELIEGSVVEAVRASRTADLLGGSVAWMSDSERNLLDEKERLWSLSSAERERAFRAVADRLVQDASMGADDDDVEEPEDDSIARFGAAIGCYGGDLPLVFGEDCFERIGSVFKASKDGLTKRLERKKKRLEKVEAKLDELETAGKSGLRVKLLQARVKVLEKSIARVEKKLEDLGEATSDLKVAKSDAKLAAKESSSGMSDEDREIEELLKMDDDELGAGPRRGGRKSKLWAMSDEQLQQILNDPNAPRHAKVMAKRVLESRQDGGKYEMSPMDNDQQNDMVVRRSSGGRGRGGRGRGRGRGGQGGGMQRHGRPPFRAPRRGRMGDTLGGDERTPFVGFFLRRAEALGAADKELSPFRQRLKDLGIKIKTGTGTAKDAAKRRAAATKAGLAARKAARALFDPAVKQGRSDVSDSSRGLLTAMMVRRKAGRQAYLASRRGGEVSIQPGPVDVVVRGWGYRFDPATGIITIISAPAGHKAGAVLNPSSDPDSVYAKVMAEIGPHVQQVVVGGYGAETARAQPWRTYGEKLSVLLDHLRSMLEQGVEGGEVETLRSELAEARRDAKLFGPDEEILDENDDDFDDENLEDEGLDDLGLDDDDLGLDELDDDLGLDDDDDLDDLDDDLGLDDDLDDDLDDLGFDDDDLDDDDDLGLDDDDFDDDDLGLDDDDLDDDDLGLDDLED